MNADHAEFDRRQFLRLAAAGAVALPIGCGRQAASVAPVTPADAPMRFPDKQPLRTLSDRPPCLESPMSAFRTDFTPNDAFFVRWHLQGIPTSIDTRVWRLKVGGHIDRQIDLSLDDLRKMEPTTIVAVNQCSGNSRGRFAPRVAGGQWGDGAMGNAKWTGVRLKDVLAKVGIQAGAVDVTFAGLDRGGLPSVPDFVKSLSVEEARHPDVLLAYDMNDEPLPMLNGFPLRLVRPGWYATYWVKALSEIMVLPKKFDGFWMAKAYRIPTTENAMETPTALATKTEPIRWMNVRSFFTTPDFGARVPVGKPVELDGISFDGGSGIKMVEVSPDGGSSWSPAALGDDHGRFSFRRWKLAWTPPAAGTYKLLVRATANDGKTQAATAGWNRAGYMRNVIEELQITAG
jgi:DMSO/TMAO reductase YedYZ molybdopterin-dependent catalytic subunit